MTNLGKSAVTAVGNAASGGLSSLASGLASGIVGEIFRPSLREQEDSQKRMMDYQSQLNKDHYDYQYSKNTPSALKRLYQDAGLNPGLMYSGAGGQGIKASMGSAGLGSLSPYSGSPATNPSMIANLENIKADSNLKEKQADNLEQQTKLVELKQISEQLNHLYTQEQTNEVKARIKELEAREQKLLAETQTENELRPFEKESIMADVNHKRAITKTEDVMRDLNYEYRNELTLNAKVERALMEFKKWYYDTYEAEIPSGIGNVAQKVLNAIIGEPGTNRENAENGDNDKPGSGWSLFWHMVNKLGLPKSAAIALQYWLRNKETD